MDRVDLKVWFACNNKCLFCVQWDKRLFYKQRSFEEIKKNLLDEYNRWLRAVVFTWWEPTIHKNLIESIKFAKNLGYVSIQIQSNWRTFANLDYLKELINAWANEFWPSIHWYKAETHDLLVWCEWARKETVQWMINIKKLKKKILTNTVITKQNYKELPMIARLLVKLGINQFQFAFAHISWSADKNKYDIIPRKTEIMKYVKEWLDIWKNAWIICMTEAIPFCLMQWYEWAIAEYNFMPETTVYDGEKMTKSYIDYRLNEWKLKRKECLKCSRNTVCEWPWKEYPELYWWEEFKPI